MKRFLYFIFTFLAVISMYAQPNWTPVNYTNSTTAYGIVTIDGLPAASGDKVGSFVGSECRAVGNITINAGTAYVTLIIQGEQVETVSFKVWQANTNTILNVVFTTQTSPGNTIGSPPNYLAITATSTSNILVVTPDYQDVNSTAGTTTFNISNSGSGTMNWTAVTNTSWMTITSGSSGTNSGTVTASYTTNTGTSRTATITITANGATGSPKTVEVRQAAASQFTVATSSNPTSGGTTAGGGIFGNGTSVTVMATPNSGYNFINWTEGSTVVSTNTSYTFTISSNRTLVANFAVVGGIITSATSGNWNSISTWIGGIIPNSLNDVVIALGTSVTVNTPSNPECNNLTINGTLIGSVNLSSNLLINGSHSNGTISVSKNVTVGTGNSFSTSSNLLFMGTSNTVLSVPATGVILGGITINKTNNTNTITLTGGDLKTSANTTFVNGMFVTGTNTFNLWVPFFSGGQGFTRVGVVGTNVSHVVGNLAKTLFSAGNGLASSCEPRQEFPIGTLTQYKMVAVTFNPAFGLPTTPNATLTVNAFDGSPGGSVGLPIQSGVSTGIDVARYPNFYWTIASAPFTIGSASPFDLELYATGFTDYDALANVRIICRYGAVSDVANDWLLLGTNNSYDNSLSGTNPTIIQRGATVGLRSGGAVFTLGVKSNIFVKTAIPKQWLVLSAGAKNYNVTQLFQGNIGTLTCVAQSSNAAVATAVILGSTLQITPVAVGDVVVTVTAQDLTYNDFFAYSFPVNVGLTDVEATDQLPTEFALYQNYPNPFNPTTTIKFSIPIEMEYIPSLQHVTLKVYDLLGREIATLVNEEKSPGNYEVRFDSETFRGTSLPSGVYFYRLQAGSYSDTKKLILIK